MPKLSNFTSDNLLATHTEKASIYILVCKMLFLPPHYAYMKRGWFTLKEVDTEYVIFQPHRKPTCNELWIF